MREEKKKKIRPGRRLGRCNSVEGAEGGGEERRERPVCKVREPGVAPRISPSPSPEPSCYNFVPVI